MEEVEYHDPDKVDRFSAKKKPDYHGVRQEVQEVQCKRKRTIRT